ncbi:MAG: helix-hairpin-helix domain-containing protein [Eubacteriales bacterium]
MKIFLDRDYFFNFVKQNKLAIIKVSVGVLLFTLAFFVFCFKQNSEQGFVLNTGSNSEIIAKSGDEKSSSNTNLQNGENDIEQENEKSKEIFVDVSGAVVNPDVYKLKLGARVYEAIKKAGGFTENANAQNLNLAAKLNDQDKIVVLTEEEFNAQNTQTSSISNNSNLNTNSNMHIGKNETAADTGGVINSSGQVNINTATAEELQTIKGVGPAMAARILEYRNSNGRFSSIEELKNVKGIGEKTFEKFRQCIRI